MAKAIGARLRVRSAGSRAGLLVRRGVAPSVLLALLAVPIVLACGFTPVMVAKAPARDVSLTITIGDQGVPASSVLVQVMVMLAGNRGFVYLTSSHTLTCNGVTLNLMAGARAVVPRQPPDGAYTFVYTDEQGQRTTLVVPVPRGNFAITSPAAGATIALPRQPNLGPTPSPTGSGFTTGGGSASLVALDGTPVPLATPTPPVAPATPTPQATLTPPATQPPSGTPTPYGQVRPPDLVSQPPILIRYTTPIVPQNGNATFQARATCGRTGAPPCAGDVFGPTLDATGVYALTDAGVAPGYGFEAFGPGAGELGAQLTMSWVLPPCGFNEARVTFDGDATLPITWTR